MTPKNRRENVNHRFCSWRDWSGVRTGPGVDSPSPSTDPAQFFGLSRLFTGVVTCVLRLLILHHVSFVLCYNLLRLNLSTPFLFKTSGLVYRYNS